MKLAFAHIIIIIATIAASCIPITEQILSASETHMEAGGVLNQDQIQHYMVTDAEPTPIGENTRVSSQLVPGPLILALPFGPRLSGSPGGRPSLSSKSPPTIA